jgi:hypothetical protein
MSRLPKLRIRLPSGDKDGYVCELEQAKDILNFKEGVFLVEGNGVQSFDELAGIVHQDKYKDKEFIEIELLQPIDGG